MEPNDLLTISQAAKYLNVSIMTLRRWDESGKLIPIKTFGRHRKYHLKDLNNILENKCEIKSIPVSDHRYIIGYARVSSSDQKEDLIRQANLLSEYLGNIPHKLIISDLGSGLNYNKKGLKKLIRMICHNEVKKIVITYKDRLIRFGYEMIEELCEIYNVEIEIINNDKEKTQEQELVEDMLSIITVFSSRLYGARSKKKAEIIKTFDELTSK